MLSLFRPVTLMIAALMAVTGCRGSWSRTYCPVPASLDGGATLECRPVERAERLPDLSSVPNEEMLRVGEEEVVWCGVDEETTRSLSAARSPLANLLTQEAALVQQQYLGQHRLEGYAHSAAATIRLAALEQRNRSASQGLQLLFRLAEVQEIERHVQFSLDEIGEILRDLETLEQQGIATPVSREEIESQRLDLLSQQSELALQSRVLSDHLYETLGESLHPERRFWPELSLQVEYQQFDAEQLLSEARADRPELRALRLAVGQPSESLGRLAQVIIPSAAPGAGLSGGGFSVLPGARRAEARQEGETRRRQLSSLLEYRERAVQREVLEALWGVEQGYLRIAWASQQLEFAERELAMARERQQMASGSPLEVRRARLKVYQSRQQVLREVVEWKVQRVKLREAQGHLVDPL
jgi:hypothetical protein